MLSKAIISFYKTLTPPANLPRGIEVLHPQRDPAVRSIIELFYSKFYADKKSRTLAFGINPGRFGAGMTGINFTASRQLTTACQIPNTLKQQSELSAEFIYEVIDRFGGVQKFYQQFFITSICPLGFTRQGVNLNYYDDKQLANTLKPFIVEHIQKQLSWQVNRKTAICIGGEKNFKFFSALNTEYQFFEKILPLPHPRFIMQYRRLTKEKFILQYLATLQQAFSSS